MSAKIHNRSTAGFLGVLIGVRQGRLRWLLAGASALLLAGIFWLDVVTGPGHEPLALYDIPVIVSAAAWGVPGALVAVAVSWLLILLTLSGLNTSLTLADLSQMGLLLIVGLTMAMLVTEYLRAHGLQESLRDWNEYLEGRIAEAIEGERAAMRRLQEAERLTAVGQAAAQIAHDINSPLTAIGGFTRRVERQLPEGHPAHEDLKVVREEVTRLEELLRDILDFAGPGRITEVPVDLRELAGQVARLLSEQGLGQGIEIGCDTSAQAGRVMGDPDLLKRAILNLAQNGIQAMPEGGTLTLRVKPAANAGRGGVALAVSDTGCGIRPEILPRVFEPFFTTKHGGTGLGLAQVRKSVEAHGGSVEVESTVGGGTTFSLWLPSRAERNDRRGG